MALLAYSCYVSCYSQLSLGILYLVVTQGSCLVLPGHGVFLESELLFWVPVFLRPLECKGIYQTSNQGEVERVIYDNSELCCYSCYFGYKKCVGQHFVEKLYGLVTGSLRGPDLGCNSEERLLP